MRVAATLFVVLGMTAVLTACTGAEDAPKTTDEPSTTAECIAESGTGSEAVTVDGDFGATPTVKFDFPLEATEGSEALGATIYDPRISWKSLVIQGSELFPASNCIGTRWEVSRCF